MNAQEFEERLRALARDHNAPPATPREAMWARIVEQRAGTAKPDAGVIPFPKRPAGKLLLWVTGVAALLLVGIGIGRLTRSGDQPAPTRIAADSGRPNVALRLVTTQHMSRVETFLTAFNSEDGDTTFLSQARELLTSTGLLLDRPGVSEPQTRALLQDLELILIQIVQLGASRARADRALVDDGLQARQVLPRLRQQIPAGPPRHSGVS